VTPTSDTENEGEELTVWNADPRLPLFIISNSYLGNQRAWDSH